MSSSSPVVVKMHTQATPMSLQATCSVPVQSAWSAESVQRKPCAVRDCIIKPGFCEADQTGLCVRPLARYVCPSFVSFIA